MTLTTLQQRTVEAVKPHTRDNPITGVSIAKAIGLKERDSGKQGADMRSIINALRTKGYPICAYGSGYYWPRNQKELDEYVDSFQGRIDDQQKACDGIRAGWDKLDAPAARKSEAMFMYRANNTMYHVLESKRAKFLIDHPDAQFVDPNA